MKMKDKEMLNKILSELFEVDDVALMLVNKMEELEDAIREDEKALVKGKVDIKKYLKHCCAYECLMKCRDEYCEDLRKIKSL